MLAGLKPLFAMLIVAVACHASADSVRGELRRALLIGNDAYAGANRLESCVNDAKAMRDWLLLVGYQPRMITLLANATHAEMTRGFSDLVQATQQQTHDQVVIYYSGHGFTLPDDDGDEGPDDPWEESLVAVDNPATLQNLEQLFIRDDQFYKYVNQISRNTRQVVIFLDCCYAGGGMKSIDLSRPAGKSKELSRTELRRLVRQAGLDDHGLLDRPVGTRSKGAGRISSGVPKELTNTQPGHSILFIASSNQYQRSQAGKLLSRFTEALLTAVGQKRHLLVNAKGVLTIEALQSDLTQTLAGVPQTPVIMQRGMRDSALIPGVFAPPKDARLRQLLERVLLELVTLDTKQRQLDWKLTATPSVPEPIAVGKRFSIRCRPTASGYLLALTVSPSGTVRFLFPNRYRPDNQVGKNALIQVPYRQGLMIQPPVGIETYYVFLLENNPFRGFDFGRYGSSLVVGQLDDLTSRIRVDGKEIGSTWLRQSLTKDFVIEPAHVQVDGSTGAASDGAGMSASHEREESELPFNRPHYRWNVETLRVHSVR